MTKHVFDKTTDEEERDLRLNWKNEVKKRQTPAYIAQLERENETLRQRISELEYYLKEIL